MADTEAPQTIREVGIYLRVIGDRLTAIEQKLNDSPTRHEHELLKGRITALELDGESYGSRYLTRRDGAVATGVISFILTGVLLVLNLWDRVGGK